MKVRNCLSLAAALWVAGCGTLPATGPTVGQLKSSVRKDSEGLKVELVPIDGVTVEALREADARRVSAFTPMQTDSGAYGPELARPSDVLTISIYEVGVSLFGSQSPASAQSGMPTAAAQTITGIKVDENGLIDLPYVGSMSVAGLSPRQIGKTIESRMRGLSQSPQVIVAITDSAESSVNLSGAVNRNGRYRLTVARQRLRDLIAEAGGAPADPEDIMVRLTRGATVADMRLSDIQVGSQDDVYLAPGDRVELLRRPRTFTVFGASDHVSQISLGPDRLNLLEAVAKAGGPSDQRANPRGVFLFRWEPVEGGEPKPVIYQLDMMQAGSYFLAGQFAMHDKDVLYFANSASNPPTKFIAILNQLFSPILTVKALTE
ncbi:polysaccharide biosynthesis/export family protein [Novosphingobium gossypii]|uniref:polysaccharide biosynthesis/export family protein n=1 Tax=Novosphingobium gossypii TaxID=1604774 RepID=UPI003D249E90